MNLLKYKIAISILIFSFSSITLSAQDKQVSNDTINKLDSLGRKNGIWVEYLTDDFKIAKNLEDAVFSRYIRYSNGIRFDWSIIHKKYIRKVSSNYRDTISNKDEIILLDGTYKLYIKKGEVLLKECVFDKGILLVQTDFSEIDGTSIISYIDKHKDHELSFSVKDYDKSGNFMSGYYVVLENSKWKTIQIK